MDSRDLKRRAEQLLREQWIPGLEQKTLMHAADELEDIVSQLTQREDPSAQTLLLRTRHLYDHAERQYFSGMPEPINSGLEQLMHRLEDLFEAHEGHSPRREATRYLLENSSLEQQRGLSALQADLTHFTHIPYSYLEASREEHQDVVGALQANNLPVIPEKHYHVHPLHAAQAQRNLELIGADKAWERARGTGVRVGIADTGVAYDHKELRERFTDNRGYNFVDNTPDPLDDHGHGTHVAGTVAGTNTGVAPEATLYALKFLNRRGSGSQVDFIRAAEWAIDHELHILNGSFGSNRPNDPEQAICDKLHQEGILFVAAAGNGGDGRYSYPASYDSVVSVAAVDYDKKRAPFSQYNDQVTISAPGVNIRSCVPGGYDNKRGTSMACPHVAGSAALVYELRPDRQSVHELLTESAQELGPATEYGAGLVQPAKALGIEALLRRHTA